LEDDRNLTGVIPSLRVFQSIQDGFFSLLRKKSSAMLLALLFHYHVSLLDRDGQADGVHQRAAVGGDGDCCVAGYYLSDGYGSALGSSLGD
jgi:hypothetical protein